MPENTNKWPRVLLYCDDPEFEGSSVYGTRVLREALVDFPVRVEIRSRETKKLDTLLKDCDEVWFLLRSKDKQLRLEPGERRALLDRMNEGVGVLITGDHAEKVEGELRGLGWPVGADVPRAGELRNWGRGPGTDPDDGALNSTVPDDMLGSSTDDLEKDDIPQRLLVGYKTGVHPIFKDRQDRYVDRLPDHNHEGEVVIPSKFPPPDWPKQLTKRPEVIAKSVDWRRETTFDCMVAWDGHAVGEYGRILADATWHHYVDHNLHALVNTPVWKKIRELYVNMAWWLAPRSFTRTLVPEALTWVGNYPGLELSGAFDEKQAAKVRSLLARKLPGPLLHGFLHDVFAAEGVEKLLVEDPGLADHVLLELVRDGAAVRGDPLHLELEALVKTQGLEPSAIERFLEVSRHLKQHIVAAEPGPRGRPGVLARAIASAARVTEQKQTRLESLRRVLASRTSTRDP